MSERFVRHFWETIIFTNEKFKSDAPTCEYIYFRDLEDSPEAKGVIFPFLLSHESANARRPIDVIRIYFPDFDELDDVRTILNNGILSLYGFKSSGDKTLLLSAPLFAIPTIQTFSRAVPTTPERPKCPYTDTDVKMQQIYDYFTIVVTFPEGIPVLTSQVGLIILTEGITDSVLSFQTE